LLGSSYGRNSFNKNKSNNDGVDANNNDD